MPPRNLLVIALTVVISLACYSAASKNKYANLFAEAMEVIDQQSLRQVSRERLFVSAMEGMLTDLDEHSMYISGEMFQVFDEDMRQEFGGVGMYVEMDPRTKNLVVLAPMPGTPAFDAGMKAGDQVLTIDGVETNTSDRRDAIKLLRGPIGEKVELKIERGQQELTKMLSRAVIAVPSVLGDFRSRNGDWQFVVKDTPRVGYIRLTQFGEKSAIEIREALRGIGGEIDGLVLDLRNNSGGLLDVAVQICDMFLPTDLPIVRTLGRGKVVLEERFSSSALELDPAVPICVLVNRNSASASEIVAGCLQDHRRAIVIGEQTWGKGTVQNVIPIQRGESALKLTTASYWRPSGKSIDRNDEISKQTKTWGVQPDQGFEIELTEQQLFDNMRQRNLNDLRGLLSPEESELIDQIRVYTPRDEESPVEVPGPDDAANPAGADKAAPSVDRALQRAVDYIKSLLERDQVAA